MLWEHRLPILRPSLSNHASFKQNWSWPCRAVPCQSLYLALKRVILNKKMLVQSRHIHSCVLCFVSSNLICLSARAMSRLTVQTLLVLISWTHTLTSIETMSLAKRELHFIVFLHPFIQFCFAARLCPSLPAATPLTCTSLQSAQTRTRPGRGHTLAGRAPAGGAPPACAPPPGSGRPRPQTRSSGQGSYCSWIPIWPQCSRRRTMPWASYWCHKGLPLSTCLLYLLRSHRGWQTLWSAIRRCKLVKIVIPFRSVLPTTSTLGWRKKKEKKTLLLSWEPNYKAVLFWQRFMEIWNIQRGMSDIKQLETRT